MDPTAPDLAPFLARESRLADLGELAGPLIHEVNNYLNNLTLHLAPASTVNQRLSNLTALATKECGLTIDEMRPSQAAEEREQESLRPVAAPGRIEAREPRHVAGAAHQVRGLPVVGVGIVAVRRNDQRGRVPPQGGHHGAQLIAIRAVEAEVGKPERLPRLHPQLAGRRLGLGGALLHAAAARGLAAGEVHDRHAVAVPGQQRRQASRGELDVVGMGPEEQRVERHHRSSTRCSWAQRCRRSACSPASSHSSEATAAPR